MSHCLERDISISLLLKCLLDIFDDCSDDNVY